MIEIRRIRQKDIPATLRILDQLADTEDLSVKRATYILDKTDPFHKVVVVAVDSQSDAVRGTGSIIFEDKLIHNGGSVAHVEDVVVDEVFRGLGVGEAIVQYLVDHARFYGCYKVILDCSEKNVDFYKKLNFYKTDEVNMRFDIR